MDYSASVSKEARKDVAEESKDESKELAVGVVHNGVVKGYEYAYYKFRVTDKTKLITIK